MDSYIIQANNFLRKHGIKFSAKPTDSGNCPQWRENCDHIHGDEHRARFSREGKSFSVLFWNSYEDARRGHQVEAYDVLSCLQKYDPGDFSEFCSEFCSEYGYDEDSRRDEKTWRAVVREWRKVEKFFNPEELTELQEIQ